MSDPIKITDLFQRSALQNLESGDFFAACLKVPAATDAQHEEIAKYGAGLIGFTRNVISPPKEMVFCLVLDMIQKVLNPQTEPERIYAFLVAVTNWRSIMQVIDPAGGFGPPVGESVNVKCSATIAPLKVMIPEGADRDQIVKIVREAFDEIAEEHRRKVTVNDAVSSEEPASNDNTEAGR